MSDTRLTPAQRTLLRSLWHGREQGGSFTGFLALTADLSRPRTLTSLRQLERRALVREQPVDTWHITGHGSTVLAINESAAPTRTEQT